MSEPNVQCVCTDRTMYDMYRPLYRLSWTRCVSVVNENYGQSIEPCWIILRVLCLINSFLCGLSYLCPSISSKQFSCWDWHPPLHLFHFSWSLLASQKIFAMSFAVSCYAFKFCFSKFWFLIIRCFLFSCNHFQKSSVQQSYVLCTEVVGIYQSLTICWILCYVFICHYSMYVYYRLLLHVIVFRVTV